ncbi:transcriptional regulator [Candidatus Pelagibacter sp.]|nr:transcriptional regulator [Candidatus Pelagibacter sp.]
MKKISLKNILKKTFKKPKAKKVTKVLKTKSKIKNKTVKKKEKKLNKVPKVKASKVIKKQPILKKEEAKSENLRITKSNEVKPEIKKIKKQETAKKEFKPKDYIVYPKHGVGQILSVSSKTIGGIEVQCYDIKFERDKAIGLLPINKQSHLRPLATINQVNKSISILKSKPKIKRSMWSRRAQEYEQKITSGKIYDLAEVVRDLNKGDDLMVDQSYSERQLFEKAYERILTEFQIVMNISFEDTQKKLDKALKRNLEKQNLKVVKPELEQEKVQEPTQIAE